MKQDNSPESQNGIALPPRYLSQILVDKYKAESFGTNNGEQWLGLRRVDVMILRERMQSLARIHALALELQRGTNVVPVRAVVEEIAQLSNPNAEE